MEEDDSLLLQDAKTQLQHSEKPYSFSKLVDRAPTPPMSRANPSLPVLRLRSRILRLLWFSGLALIAGCIGVSMVHQESVGTVINKVGSCISTPPNLSMEDLALQEEQIMPWDSSLYLHGPPTESFAGPSVLLFAVNYGDTYLSHQLENLRAESQYVTSWTYAGWSESQSHFVRARANFWPNSNSE